ncbi:MAG: hypothetical protein HC801_13180 [Nitrospira sp.]|nr:hypothetical protein [Nitrospira sp.]
MNDRGKTLVSLSTLALLSITMTCDAYAGTNRSERRTIEQVRSCVSEIARHANYNDASRAIHWVDKLTQKNLAELEIRIETTIYAADGELVSRKYRTSCVVAGLRNLVDFRIDPVELDSETQS